MNDTDNNCIIVIGPNKWARGQTIQQALEQFKALHSVEGIKAVTVVHIIGDNHAQIGDMGGIKMHKDASLYELGTIPVTWSRIKAKRHDSAAA